MDFTPQHIIYFDGDCLLCNRFIQLLLKVDKRNVFCFCALQSEHATVLRAMIPPQTDSIVYKNPKTILIKSKAIFAIAETLGFPYSLLSIFKILPTRWTDNCYDFIAKNRYKWFGKNENCLIMTPANRKKFI